jgi:MEMO1 family protein
MLESTANELGRKVCYIAGADMCHIGKKFGDDFAARSILPDVQKFDMEALKHAAGANADEFLRSIAQVSNKYRVCGVAPIYATLRAARPQQGELLCYYQWDESERESAVTFASVALYR